LGSYSSNRQQRNALRALPVQRKVANCTCGQAIFFPNSECLACGNALGYAPDQGTPTALLPGEGGLWQLPEASSGLYRRCA
ncbi:zinc-ribbon domain-containing protein, partial [Streptomyces sp. CHB9.2]|nr:zinc-ribbon domain-containing protein [Streptomyces sp. CHB9.2]